MDRRVCLQNIKLSVIKILLSILFILSVPALSIEDNSFRFQNITIKDGLSQNTVKCLLQDSQGFIWLGTMNGLNRYDGTEFTVMMQEYGNKASLSDNRIRTIQEDAYGYIWLQTNINNVSCYNTRLGQFVNYHPFSTNHIKISMFNSGDVWLWGHSSGCLQVIHQKDKLKTKFFGKGQLGSENVRFLFEGNEGTAWIGTNNSVYRLKNGNLALIAQGNGFHTAIESGRYIYCLTNQNKILIFDKDMGKLIHEVHCSFKKNNIKINDIALLTSELILITTENNPYVFNTNSLKTKPANPYFNNKTLQNAYTYLDNKQNLWIYNKSGSIWQFDKSNRLFREIKLIPPSILSFIDMERYSVYHDSRNIIWITTYGNGLFAIDQNTGKITHFKHNPNEMSGLRTNFLLSITEDRSGEIWVGTEYAGISKISITPNKNILFTPGGDNASDGDKIVRLIYEDEKENLWIGTKNGNLFIYDKEFTPLIKHNIYGGMPYALTEDTAGNKWIGTKGKGLLVFNRDELKKYRVYDLPSLESNSKSNNNLYSICKDSKGRMWLATFGDGLFLAKPSKAKMTFKNFREISKAQSRMRTIVQDSRGLIWVGGNNGIVVFYPDNLIENEQQFISFRYDNRNPRSINNNEVKVIFKDSRDRIWIGTSGGGVNLALKSNSIEKTWFKHYTTEEGLINNIVQGIQEDDEENLWISTEAGVSKFNTTSGRFENYNFSDNWQANLFCESAYYKRKNGDILFGSYYGLYILKQDYKADTSYSPPVKITEIKINGTNVPPGNPDSPLKEAACMTRKIRLRYDQNSFSIQFAVLNYRNPAANSFTYILEGYERSWNPVTRHNIAVYRNIPSGNYTFKVKGCNSLGIWNNQETTLEIKVIPPFWRSPLAFIFYTVIIFVSGFIAIKTIMKINKLNTAVKIEQQLTEFKLQFFTNISHEFRSPLTIIQGTIENIKEKENLPPVIKRQIGLLEKSSQRLLRLINQLLTFRQVQNNSLVINTEQTESVAFFKEIFVQFEELAGKKGIKYKFSSTLSTLNMPIDRSKMDKIIFNLLSNAFKFTPENGQIDFELQYDKLGDTLKILVSDSGIGVPKDKQDLLFMRFKQIRPSAGGTGIGLHLTAELVKMLKGTIRYIDSKYGGACFIVEIPLSESNNGDKGITDGKEQPEIPDLALLKSQDDDNKTYKEIEIGKAYKILVIDDDPEINDFLRLKLDEYFKVVTAKNGLEGLKKCISEQPDLIISDVMMPEMDGYEITKRLKDDFRTCHIPIVMLTAYSSLDHQIQGINSGADSYITKPFSLKYLITRIVKLLEQREKLQEKFTKEPGLDQIPTYTIDRDNEFIKEIHKIIEQNIDNPEFSMDTFALKVKLSRTAFFKKVKGLTGYTPNEYLRILRMKKAAELLLTTNLNVSEVAFKVGLNNPFYFTKCFKNQFGTTPSAFAKKGNLN